MSRRRPFREELCGVLPEGRSLKFESGLVVQISEGLGHRRDLVLLNNASLTKIPGLELSQRKPRNRQAGHIRHDALEPDRFRCGLEKQRAGNQCGTRRALPHLLAADFCFHLPTWLFDPRR